MYSKDRIHKTKNTKMKKQFLIIGLAIMLFSCSSPLDKKFNRETLEADLEAIKEKISDTEMRILGAAIVHAKSKGQDLTEKTYAELLEKGKKWKVEVDKAKAAKNKKMTRLRSHIVVSCFGKEYIKIGRDAYLALRFKIKNKSDKTVRAVKGEVIFTDLFDEKIASVDFIYEKPLEAGAEATWEPASNYNQYKESDRKMKMTAFKNMKVTWEPEKIIFKDGSSLE